MLEKLVAFGSALLIAANLFASTTGQSPQSGNKTLPIFNPTTQQYTSIPGGLHEGVLNELGGIYQDPKTINLMAFYDHVESGHEFKHLPFEDSQNSELELLNTVRKNLYVIPLIDDYNLDEVYANCTNLKKLMLDLDTIYESEATDLVKFQSMYNRISEDISTDGDVDGTLDLLELTNGVEGDCSEATASYYSLLSYYGFDVSMRIGYAVNNTGSYGHAWLHADVDGQSFDVDPTFYDGTFTPLEDRGTDIRYVVTADEYVSTKTIAK